MMVRVAVAQDQPLFARTLRAALAEQDVEVVGIAGSGRDAVELVEGLEPDLLLLSLSFPDAFEALEALRDRGSPVRVVALAPEGARGLRSRAVDLGVSAFVRSEAEASEVGEALRLLGHLGGARSVSTRARPPSPG
jgi:two-component system, NarL family, response regulator DesR